jgi:hypothetical protein
MIRPRKISPKLRKELESKLAARFAKTSKTGMAKRLLKGEDVENHLTKTFKEHSDKTTKDIDKKTQDAIVSINQRIDAVLKYMQSVVQAKVDGIRVPEDGRTPSADEIKALLSPMVDETRTQFTQRISKIEDLLTKAPKESDVPTDLKGLEAFVKSKIPKLGGGGGGASYLFELFDTPAKSKSRQGAYVGYEGLVLAVSDDGKGLVFQESGSSLPDQSGNNGKFLSTDGTDASWETVSAGTVDVVSNVATDRILGRTTAGSGDSEQLTASEVRTLINVADGATADQDLSGLLPKAGGTMTGNIALNGNYLSGDGGDEGVFVDSSGNVGIGTASPSTVLHIEASNPTLTIEDSRNGSPSVGDTMASINFKSKDTSSGYQDEIRASIAVIQENTFGSAQGIAFYTHPIGTFAERMRITNDGNVGIGTTSPSALLHVSTAGADDVLRLERTSTSDYVTVDFSGGNANLDASSPFNMSVSGQNFLTYSSADSALRLSSGGVERLTILSSGNVGIGTASPSAKLDVNGAIKLANSNYLSWGLSGSRIVGSGSFLRFQTGSNDRLSIDSSGNVGIGTTSPDTKLQVAGAITQQPLSSDPADPDAGNSVQWVSSGVGSGDAGDIMLKVNVGGTTKVITLIDYSVA